MKEFWIYTLLRVVLFVACAAVVFGIWFAIAGEAPVMWVLVIGLVLSGLASFFVLGSQRSALARHVDDRAQRMSAKIEEMRTKEDLD